MHDENDDPIEYPIDGTLDLLYTRSFCRSFEEYVISPTPSLIRS